MQRIGISGLLQETWKRYHLPMAITECHIGCTREEQMRWLHEVWQAARRARASGVDVRAVTSWALLGSHDWNSLVTRETDYYEPGVFDVRGPVPRPTALAAMVRALATDGSYDHPVLATPGWWNRGRSPFSNAANTRVHAPPILIIENGEQHGRELVKTCESARARARGDRPRRHRLRICIGARAHTRHSPAVGGDRCCGKSGSSRRCVRATRAAVHELLAARA